MKTPEERIQCINQSMRCFVLGLSGFIPLVGIVPAILAIIFYRRTRLAAGDDWNPARTYLMWGMLLGWFNLIIETLVWTALIIGIVAVVLENDSVAGSD